MVDIKPANIEGLANLHHLWRFCNIIKFQGNMPIDISLIRIKS